MNKHYFYILILNIFFLVIFAAIAGNVLSGGLIVQIDKLTNAKINSLHTPFITAIIKIITNITDPLPLFIISLAVLALLICLEKRHESILFAAVLAAGALSSGMIKNIIHRSRPSGALIETDGFSFPSRHAVLAIIFFSLLIYFFRDKIKNKLLKKLFIAANVLIFLAVGLSRIYLNIHWLSDVIAGFALGFFILTLFILVFKLAKSSIKK